MRYHTQIGRDYGVMSPFVSMPGCPLSHASTRHTQIYRLMISPEGRSN